MSLKLTHIVAIVVAVVAVVGVAAAFMVVNKSSEPDYTDVNMTVETDGGNTKLVIESNKDLFKNVNATNVKVCVTDLDEYVYEDWFNTEEYLSDLSTYGVADEYYGIIIPQEAVEKTGSDITVSLDSNKKLSISFPSMDGDYYLYQVLFLEGAVDLPGDEGASIETQVIPKGEMVVPTFTIDTEIYENTEVGEIEVSISDAVFAEDVRDEFFVFGGGLQGLEATGATKLNDTTLKITVDGTVPRSNGVPGILMISGLAYVGPSWYSSDVLTATTPIKYNLIMIDPFDMDLADETNMSVPIYFTEAYHDSLTTGKLTIRDFETKATISDVTLKNVVQVKDDTFDGYMGDLIVPVGVLFQDEFQNFQLYSGDNPYADLATYSDAVYALVYDVSEDYLHFKVSIVPLMDDFADDVTKDNFTFPDGFNIDSFVIEDGIAYFELSAESAPYVEKYSIDVKEGTFVDLWGKPVSEVFLSIVFTEDEPLSGGILYGVGEVSTDEMIKALYSANKIAEISSIVEFGVGVLSTILEASGLISIPDPAELRFQALMLQCERIQIMLADITAKLDKVSNQIMQLDYKLDKIQMKMLQDEYGKYVNALNNLENTATMFSKHLKTDIYNKIINGSGNFYIYLIENEKKDVSSDIFSIKHGNYWEEYSGGVIGDHTVLQTVALPIGPSTFVKTSQQSKYVDGKFNQVGTTPYYMLQDLEAYYTQHPISGYKAHDLAIGTYKAIIYKLIEMKANEEGGDSDKLINAYKQYVSVTASLHGGTYDPYVSNGYYAGIELLENRYNFYGEVKDAVKIMNYSAALSVFSYGILVMALDQLAISGDDTIENFVNNGVTYLKDHNGVRSSDHYSYVAHGNLATKRMDIYAEAVFKSKDNFKTHVYDELTSQAHHHNLGQNKYVNTDMLKKINMRWQALGSPESTLSKYLTKYVDGSVGTYLMTRYDGEGQFTEGDCMYLQSAKNNIVTEHGSYQIIPPATWFTLAGSFSAIKTYHETFSNIKHNFTYKGEAVVVDNLTPVKVGGKDNCLYAFAALTDHRWSFTYDEATIFTSWGYYDDDSFGYSLWGKNMTYYHKTHLDYLNIC